MLLRYRTIAAALAFATLPALAQDETTDVDGTLADKALAVGDEVISGWTGTAGFGASFATGSAESNNVNGSLRLIKTYNRWDHVLTASVFKGSSTTVVTRRNADGEVVLDDSGFPQRDIIKGDNSDRLTLGYQPKYYFDDKLYAFVILDYEADEPANVDSSTRQIVGVGYSFYRDATGYLAGELGFGNKTLEPVFGDELDGGIAYLGLNYLTRISDAVTLNADLRSDFGSDNTFLEIGLGAAFKLSDRFSLKISHFSRSNTDLDDPGNPLDSSVDSITGLNLVVDL